MDTIQYPKRVRARKQHVCTWCDRAIERGEEYTLSVYKGDTIYSWRECDRCKPYVDKMFEDGHNEEASPEDFQSFMWEFYNDIACRWWLPEKETV